MSDDLQFPIFQRDLEDLFGSPRAGDFAEYYLRTMDFSDLAPAFDRVRDWEGNPWSYHIYGNGYMEAPLRRAFQNLIDRGCSDELKTYDGCFNIRLMKGGSSYSVHSWGLAVDFNAAENPFGGRVSFSPEFIKCFADAGFESGSLWRTKDGMHFQLPWTQDWRGSKNPLAPQVYPG
jgi:hypothetical protein